MPETWWRWKSDQLIDSMWRKQPLFTFLIANIPNELATYFTAKRKQEEILPKNTALAFTGQTQLGDRMYTYVNRGGTNLLTWRRQAHDHRLYKTWT